MNLQVIHTTTLVEPSRQPYPFLDPPSCYELFRRAFVTKDEAARNAMYTYYFPMVEDWVQRHPCFAETQKKPTYFANLVFMQLGGAFTSEKLTALSDLHHLFRYIQMCVHSVIVNYRRDKES